MVVSTHALPENWLAANPFGITVHANDIIESLGFLDDWEQRYRYILDLGRDLPHMPPEWQDEARLLRGCQSQVWIAHEQRDNLLHFMVDADAHIVRGLIAIVLSACNARPAEQILALDMDAYFGELDLLRHLTPTRGNGLRALVGRVRHIASTALCPASRGAASTQ